MGSIYDFNAPPQLEQEEEIPRKRGRKRETLTSTEVVQAKSRLAQLVDRAFQTLEEAMTGADFNTAVKASQIVLDRAGFGPKTTQDVNVTTLDLSALTKEELAARALQIAANLNGGIAPQQGLPQVIDVGRVN